MSIDGGHTVCPRHSEGETTLDKENKGNLRTSRRWINFERIMYHKAIVA